MTKNHPASKLESMGRNFEPLAANSDRLELIYLKLDDPKRSPNATERQIRDAEQAWYAANDRAKICAREILALPARTIEGLIVKAKVSAWCHGGDPTRGRNIESVNDVSAAFAVVHDLIALAASSDKDTHARIANRA